MHKAWRGLVGPFGREPCKTGPLSIVSDARRLGGLLSRSLVLLRPSSRSYLPMDYVVLKSKFWGFRRAFVDAPRDPRCLYL